MVSGGVPYDQLTEKTQVWFTEVLVQHTDKTQKWTAAALQSLSGTPRGTAVKEILPVHPREAMHSDFKGKLTSIPAKLLGSIK